MFINDTIIEGANIEDQKSMKYFLDSLDEFKDQYGTSFSNAEPDMFEFIEHSLIERIAFTPLLFDHDHEEYFTKRVVCGCCKKVIGSWDYGREWCDGSKEYFIEHHKYCNECGHPIDWSEVEE